MGGGDAGPMGAGISLTGRSRGGPPNERWRCWANGRRDFSDGPVTRRSTQCTLVSGPVNVFDELYVQHFNDDDDDDDDDDDLPNMHAHAHACLDSADTFHHSGERVATITPRTHVGTWRPSW